MSKYDEHESKLRVETVNGLVTFDFNDDGVMIGLPCDKQLIPWSEWEHIARVYGKRRMAETE